MAGGPVGGTVASGETVGPATGQPNSSVTVSGMNTRGYLIARRRRIWTGVYV